MKKATLLKRYTVYVFLCLVAMTRAYAQEAAISGKITDEAEAVLPGVTVLLKGTSIGTSTNNEGVYLLKVPNAANSTMVFSFVGYKPQEAAIGSRTSIDLVLALDVKALSDVTGAIASVSAKDMRDQPVARVDYALQGRSPGLVIQNNDASPNASVSIRGSNSTNGCNDPLIVINGLLGGDLSSINPNDIENATKPNTRRIYLKLATGLCGTT